MSEHFKRISKNLIILLLLVSLLVLTLFTWFGDIRPGNAQRREAFSTMFGGLMQTQEKPADVYDDYEAYDDTMSVLLPVRAVVRAEKGMSCLADRSAVRELFERTGNLVISAFDTAFEETELSDSAFQTALLRPHILFDFAGELPMDVFAAALGVETTSSFLQNVRYLLLSAGQDMLQLVLKQGNGTAISYQTEVDGQNFAGLLSEYGVGTDFYAFEAIEFSHLPAEVVLQTTRQDPAVYLKTPIFPDYTSTSSDRVIDTVLESFGYHPYGTGGYIDADQTRVYVEEMNTLRISPDGALSYTTSLADTLVAAEPDTGDQLEILSDAAARIDHMMASYVGDVSIHMERAFYEEKSGRYVILFGCTADGIPLIFKDGYFARFEYTGSTLTGAYLTLASYYRTQQTDALLPDIQAAAAVDGDCSLFELRYRCGIEDAYHAGWYTLTD